MQSLEYSLRDELARKTYDTPPTHTGVSFAVEDGKESVILRIEGREIECSIRGARDLAMALRQSANRVENEMLDRLPGKRKKKPVSS